MPFVDPDDQAWAIQRLGAEPGIWLATIFGDDYLGVTRIANHEEDVVSRGETFQRGGFDLSLPSDNEEQPTAQMSVSNIDMAVGRAVLLIRKPISITFELVRPSNLDVPVKRVAMLKLRVATIDPITVVGQLSAARHDVEPYISVKFGPRDFPWLEKI